MKYFDELKRSMEWLAEKPETLFLGQAVQIEGTGMFNTLKDISDLKRYEMPVFEDTQMGITNGLALTGLIPISIYPRWNFLLLATNQLVNHLDKLTLLGWKSKAIIRTSVGSERPMHPGLQHIGDYSEAYKIMCPNLEVICLGEPDQIFPAYQKAYERDDGKSTILVEYGDFYNEK